MSRWMQSRPALAFGLLLVLSAGLLGGCSFWKADRASKEIDPPPPGYEELAEAAALAPAADPGQPTMRVTVYYEDPNGFVAPVTVSVPETNSVARTVLEHMVEGGPGEALVPEGFRALLPKDTKVLGINVLEDGTAIVDFSEHFVHYNLQDERKIVEAVTWALTQFDTIDRVLLWLEGQRLEEMPVDGLPLGALTRAIGINLERAPGVRLGSFTPVTLYFLGQLEDPTTYLVPVTRLIPRTDDVAAATLEQLIEGPMHASLSSVLLPTVQVLGIRQQDGLIHVDFDEELLNPDHRIADESVQAIVLSLTETTGAMKVQVSVQGGAEAVSSGGGDLSQPVERPVHINEWKW